MGVGLFADDDEACLDERIAAVIGKHRFEVLPPVRREAEAEPRGDFARQPALFEILDRLRCAAQRFAVVVAGRLHQIRQRRRGLAVRRRISFAPPAANAALTAIAAAAPTHGRRFLRHRQADRLRQLAHGFRERQARMLHQKAYGRAVRAAAEAVIELLRRTHGERRALLVVERAQAHEVRAAFLELDVLTHHVDDVDAVQQILKKGVRNHER